MTAATSTIVRVTDHAYERGKERLGLGRKAFEHIAQKAFDLGRPPSAYRGAFRRFLDGLYLERRNANNVRVYGEFVYLFNFNSLITVIHVPHRLKSGLRKAA